jgi:hypothetical protein
MLAFIELCMYNVYNVHRGEGAFVEFGRLLQQVLIYIIYNCACI